MKEADALVRKEIKALETLLAEVKEQIKVLLEGEPTRKNRAAARDQLAAALIDSFEPSEGEINDEALKAIINAPIFIDGFLRYGADNADADDVKAKCLLYSQVTALAEAIFLLSVYQDEESLLSWEAYLDATYVETPLSVIGKVAEHVFNIFFLPIATDDIDNDLYLGIGETVMELGEKYRLEENKDIFRSDPGNWPYELGVFFKAMATGCDGLKASNRVDITIKDVYAPSAAANFDALQANFLVTDGGISGAYVRDTGKRYVNFVDQNCICHALIHWAKYDDDHGGEYLERAMQVFNYAHSYMHVKDGENNFIRDGR
ncbi:MAG TPA: hypothetical protein VE842_09055, partial [Pyrinomonadaceae bacterium]|nr:hypothetical protein [Pyrinomonadaceae bacterium]